MPPKFTYTPLKQYNFNPPRVISCYCTYVAKLDCYFVCMSYLISRPCFFLNFSFLAIFVVYTCLNGFIVPFSNARYVPKFVIASKDLIVTIFK